MRGGVEYMIELASWYEKTSAAFVGRFLPDWWWDRRRLSHLRGAHAHHRISSSEDTPVWGYFCQISDSTPSYGSYSGAVPNEKITWGKLAVDTPRYVIESDATIVVPLMFAMILGKYEPAT